MRHIRTVVKIKGDIKEQKQEKYIQKRNAQKKEKSLKLQLQKVTNHSYYKASLMIQNQNELREEECTAQQLADQCTDRLNTILIDAEKEFVNHNKMMTPHDFESLLEMRDKLEGLLTKIDAIVYDYISEYKQMLAVLGEKSMIMGIENGVTYSKRDLEYMETKSQKFLYETSLSQSPMNMCTNYDKFEQ